MRKYIVVTALAMGAALMPAAAFCQTQSDSPAIQVDGRHTSAVPPQEAANAMKQAAASSVPEEDQATQEQVARLFDVMRLHQQMELMIKQVSTMMQQQIAAGMKDESADLPDGKKPAPELLAARQQLMAKFMDRAMNVYTVDQMLADATPIYQRHISRSDIEAFIAFFGSSAGQHFIDQQPLIAKEYMPVVMAHVQENTKTLTEQMKKELEELDAKGRPGANAPAPQ